MNKEKGYIETCGLNGTRRKFTPDEYEAFLKKIEACPGHCRPG